MNTNELKRPFFDGRDFEAIILITKQDITFCDVSEYERVKGLGVIYRVNLTSVSQVSGDYWMPINDGQKKDKIMKLTKAYYDYMNCKRHPYLIEENE